MIIEPSAVWLAAFRLAELVLNGDDISNKELVQGLATLQDISRRPDSTGLTSARSGAERAPDAAANKKETAE